MAKDDNISVRADEDLVERLDATGDRYEMDRSKLIRILIGRGLDIVERDGLDSLLDRADGLDEPDEDDDRPREGEPTPPVS